MDINNRLLGVSREVCFLCGFDGSSCLRVEKLCAKWKEAKLKVMGWVEAKGRQRLGAGLSTKKSHSPIAAESALPDGLFAPLSPLPASLSYAPATTTTQIRGRSPTTGNSLVGFVSRTRSTARCSFVGLRWTAILRIVARRLLIQTHNDCNGGCSAMS